MKTIGETVEKVTQEFVHKNFPVATVHNILLVRRAILEGVDIGLQSAQRSAKSNFRFVMGRGE